MFTKKLIKGLAVIVSTSVFSMSTIQSAFAAPGALATAPLFLSNIVEPNVFLTLDDSGSMGWTTMVEDNVGADAITGLGGFATSSGTPLLGGLRMGYWHPSWSGRPFAETVPPSELAVSNWDDMWVFRTHHGNSLYYNPAKTYPPWAGTDEYGDPMYEDAVVTKVLQDPDAPSGNWVDITKPLDYTNPSWKTYSNAIYLPSYYIWNDDGDGVLETTDSHTLVTINVASTAEMLNFANWFQYYRSRMNVTKAVIGNTINNTDAFRVGLDVFNNGIRKYSKSLSDTTNKRELLEEFYGTEEETYTPARSALYRVGEYFKSDDSNAPILPDTKGGECQQNFNILLTDGYWNRTFSGVGDRDSDGGSGTNDTEFDGNQAQSNDGGNYADSPTDSYSDTLADIAMKYYEEDLRDDLNDLVPTQPLIDEADHQHLVTFAVAFGLAGTLDPKVDNPLADDGDPLTVDFEWPEPVSDTATTVDDLWHAAYNGRGKFLSARDRGELATSLDAALADIAKATATAAAVSINSAKLTTESVVYLAEFNTNGWQGNLFAYKITDPSTGALSIDLDWGTEGAAGKLNGRDPDTRTILTHNGSGGVPFQWVTSTTMSDTQKNDLRTNPAGGVDADVIAQARVEYLRGSQDDEGGGYAFRVRESLLSDLVNSGPVFVGAPDLNWPDTAPFPTDPTTRYSTFKKDEKTRDGMVYVGSNGGMLHGFAEADGVEKIAYIPGNLFSTASGKGLHYLTDPTYSHTYYNDLTPTVSDIYADIGNSVVEWNTVLISGQRGGGRGIFALDVTNPANFTEGNAADLVLWEFSNSDDADLGYTYSKPQIARTNSGSWVAIFGNGYNDTGDGKAKLFIVDIAKGAVDGTWDLGTNYIKISTESGAADPDQNGLATPALADLDGNGTVDRVYAGDLNGQMWAFDLSSTDSGSWDDASNVQLLFTTVNNEPITSQPALARHPTISNDGTNAPNIMVFFGSGQYLVNGDKDSDDDNYFYGVWDKGDKNLSVANGDLAKQIFDPNYAPARVLTRNTVDYTAKYGWYFELDVNRERSVTNPVVRGDLVFFNSFVPEDEPCTIGGFGYRFAVEMLSGGSPYEVAIDANNDGDIDDVDKAKHSDGTSTDTIAAIRQEGFLPEPVFIENFAYTAEKPSLVADLPEPPTGRFGWQELIQ
jgi:type IV pilus assembly protein PilY1